MTRLAGHAVAMSETGTVRRGQLREGTAEEIRVLLARRRISAAELARRAGMKQSTLARRMTGEIAFDLDDLEAIADVLGVTILDLLPSAMVRPNNRSGAVTSQTAPAADRTTPERPRRPRQPNGRPAGESTRPASSVRPSQRRPSPIRPAGRTMPR